jgi:hypothetical protein
MQVMTRTTAVEMQALKMDETACFYDSTYDHCGDEQDGADAYYNGFIDGCMLIEGNHETPRICNGCISNTMNTKYLTIVIALLVLLPIQYTYAGGPRGDWPSDATQEGGDCWVHGYDAGFAGKYDKERADYCKTNGEDNYNKSWPYACKDAGYMPDECQDFINNPTNLHHASLEEENRRDCYDDGYEDGKEDTFDSERNYRCSEFGDPYRDGFMAACQFGNTNDYCNSFTEITQTQEQTNITAGVSITDDQDNRYYVGFDWQGVCTNPLVRNYISQPCKDLVTSDGNALTSDGKAAMETLLCPQGRSIIGIIELAYKPIPSSLEEELASACGWS